MTEMPKYDTEDLLRSLLGWLTEALDTGDLREVEKWSREVRQAAAKALGHEDIDDFRDWRDGA